MMVGARLRFKTSHPTQFVDITERLRQEVRKAGLRMGRVHLQSMHTTVGIAVNENEPLLLRDFEGLLERLAPAGAGYHHDDFARRFDIRPAEPINGHAHCRQLLLTGFATLLVEDGDLVLGRWQSVFAVELDGPRARQLAIQLDGEFEAKKASSPPRGEVARTAGGVVSATAAADQVLVELELTRQLLVDPEPVAVPMRRLVEAGGKRLRPRLVQLTARVGPRQA